ncbi:MAG: EndoU domain-containing protein [Bryobacterales bacterium]|nr:EndoU domain-containing protein [Bryobacterales bacterium]
MGLSPAIYNALLAARDNARAAANTATADLTTASTTTYIAPPAPRPAAFASLPAAGAAATASRGVADAHAAALTAAINAADKAEADAKAAYDKAAKANEKAQDRLIELKTDLLIANQKLSGAQQAYQSVLDRLPEAEKAARESADREAEDCGPCTELSALEDKAAAALRALQLEQNQLQRGQQADALQAKREELKALESARDAKDAIYKEAQGAHEEAKKKLAAAKKEQAKLEQQAVEADKAKQTAISQLKKPEAVLKTESEKLAKAESEFEEDKKRFAKRRDEAKADAFQKRAAGNKLREDDKHRARMASLNAEAIDRDAETKVAALYNEIAPLQQQVTQMQERAAELHTDLGLIQLGAESAGLVDDAQVDQYLEDLGEWKRAVDAELEPLEAALPALEERLAKERAEADTRAEAIRKDAAERSAPLRREASEALAEARHKASKAHADYEKAITEADQKFKDAVDRAKEPVDAQRAKVDEAAKKLEEVRQRVRDAEEQARKLREQGEDLVRNAAVPEHLAKAEAAALEARRQAANLAKAAAQIVDDMERALRDLAKKFRGEPESTIKYCAEEAPDRLKKLAEALPEAKRLADEAAAKAKEQFNACRQAKDEAKAKKKKFEDLQADEGARKKALDDAVALRDAADSEKTALEPKAKDLATDAEAKKLLRDEAVAEAKKLNDLQKDLEAEIARAQRVSQRPIIQPQLPMAPGASKSFNPTHTFTGELNNADPPQLAGAHHATLYKNANTTFTPTGVPGRHGVYNATVQRGVRTKTSSMWPDAWDEEDIQRAVNASLHNAAFGGGYNTFGYAYINGSRMRVNAQQPGPGSAYDFQSVYPQYQNP